MVNSTSLRSIILLILISFSFALGNLTPITSSMADFEYIWSPSITDGSADWYNTTFNIGKLENKRNKNQAKTIYMIARFDDVGGNPTIGADIIIPDNQGSIFSGQPGKENLSLDSLTGNRLIVEQSWLLTECPEFETIDLSLLILDIEKQSTGSPQLKSLVVRTKCHPIPAPGALLLGIMGTCIVPYVRRAKLF